MNATDLIHNLVKTHSLSGEEQDATAFLISAMEALKYNHAFIDEVGNAVGIRGREDAAKTIVLLGHIDTVAGDIPVRIEDGVLHGRGSVDAKGPLATFVMAAAQAQIDDETRLIVIGAVEEEAATSKGAHFVKTQYQPDFCIIGEPSGWDGVTLGYKGRILIDYRISAEMGHTAGQGSGVAESAITWWNQVDATIQEYNADKPLLFDQLIPSIRSFQTGSDGLYDWAEMRISIRTPLDFDADSFVAITREWAVGATIDSHSHEHAYRSDYTTPLARAFNLTLRRAGTKPRFKVKTGTSDMNVVAPVWQCPIVAYGPGDSTLDHTPHEHLVLAEYEKAIAILKSVLEKL
jgi:LysW-gamma-L-lysine carboxypeptidase